jgi:hypothetical protein
MTALDQLNAYLRRLEVRMRLLAATRGAAIIALAAVLLTAVLAWICNRFAFADRVVLPVRVLLYLSVAAAICFGLVIPLLRLNRRWVAKRAEQQMHGFNERLLTLAERGDASNPFTELLAEDALEVAKRHDPAELAPATSLFGLLASSAVAASILLWLILAAPGYWGYGASLLWAGTPRSTGPLYDIKVSPGDRTIRRKSDQLVTARLVGFSADKVSLYAKYKGGVQWDEVRMQPQRDGNGYEFLFASLSDPVEYYVAAKNVRSKNFRIGVKDLPNVKHLKVRVRYPAYLGLKDQVDDPGGDVRAVAGSEAEIDVMTDRPLDHGVLVLEDGRKVNLERGDGNWVSAKLPVAKDGSYHVAALDEGQAIRLTDDYFVEAKEDTAPSVKIVNPQRDPHVSPIEELPVTVETADDFGLKNVELHYSVNGGDEKTIRLKKTGGDKQMQGKTTLSFEDFKVVPGDLVSFYATASDAKNTARTDLMFAQAEPFDLRFQQSQQMGGGGGGGAGNESSQISERQKEIIAATWNVLRNGAKDKSSAAEESRFLSDVEAKLGQQAKTLADRMRSRELSNNSAEFNEFSKQMDRASEEMANTAGHLKNGAWEKALPPGQKALQSLTRAEALFKDIQIAYGRRNGGGGGGAMGANRDLERMFDLELDTEKNQYETAQSASSPSQQQKDLDDALQKLKALAQRQQELAARRQQEQTAQQRWEQEMLRREAEQLQRQMQQLSQNQQNGQPSDQQSSSQSASSSSPSSSSSGSRQNRQSASSRSQGMSQQMQARNQQLQQAADELQRAQDEMRKAVSQHDAGAQQRAASDLQAAENRLRNLQQRQAGDSVDELAAQAQQMLQQQKDFSNRVRQAASQAARSGPPSDSAIRRYMYGGRWNRDPNDPSRRAFPSAATRQTDQLADEKARMADQLEQLQRQIQRQARNAASAQPDLSAKLRDALSDIEQQDLAARMKKNSEWIRQGYGAEAWVNEQSATLGLDQFNQQMQQARAAAQNSPQQANSGQQDPETARALQQVEQLRRQLGQASQAGQAGQPGQQNARGGGPMPGGSPAIAEAMQNLASLRQRLASRNGRAYYDSEYAFRFLQDLEGADPAELTKRLNREVLPSLERLEMDIKREAKAPPDGGRLAASEPTPDTYRDAVAEYFKKLSK